MGIDKHTLTINSVDVTNYVETKSIKIKSSLKSTGSFSCKLIDLTSSLNVLNGHVLQFSYDSNLLFAGIVSFPETEYLSGSLNESQRIIKVKAIDWTKVVSRFTESAAYESQNASDVIRDLIERILEPQGFNDNGVEDSLEVGRMVFDWKPLSQIFDSIADLVGYVWKVKPDKTVVFSPHTLYTAPFNLTDSYAPFSKLTIKEDLSYYRNVQIGRGGNSLENSKTFKFYGDGLRREFTVSDPIGSMNWVTVNDVEKQVGIRGVDDQDEDNSYQWFWSEGSNVVSQKDNDDTFPVGTGDIIKVNCRTLKNLTIIYRDEVSIAARKTIEGFGTGEYWSTLQETKVDDTSTLAAWIEEAIRKYAIINKVLSITLKGSELYGIEAGQLQTINLTREGINDTFLITEVSRAFNHGGFVVTTYKCIDNTAVGGWPEFWKRLVDQGKILSIDEEAIISPVSQKGHVVNVTVTDSTATGDSLGSASLDVCTVPVIGDGNTDADSARIGYSFTEDDVLYTCGSVMGDYDDLY